MIMTAAIGFLMIIAIVALLLKGKMSPIVVLAVIPVIAALILGFSPVEVMDFLRMESKPPQAMVSYLSFQ